MARYGDFYQNKVTGERGVVLRGDEDSGDQPALVHLVVQPQVRTSLCHEPDPFGPIEDRA
jgi:hypothetical protein